MLVSLAVRWNHSFWCVFELISGCRKSFFMTKVINNRWHGMGNGAWIDWGESYCLGIYNDLEYLQEAFIQLSSYKQIYHIHIEIHVFQVSITAIHTCACTLTHALTHMCSHTNASMRCVDMQCVYVVTHMLIPSYAHLNNSHTCPNPLAFPHANIHRCMYTTYKCLKSTHVVNAHPYSQLHRCIDASCLHECRYIHIHKHTFI